MMLTQPKRTYFKISGLDLYSLTMQLKAGRYLKNITLEEIAKKFNVNVRRLELFLLRKLGKPYSLLAPEEISLNKLTSHERDHNGYEYSLFDIHTAILQDVNLHRSRPTMDRSAALFGMCPATFKKYFSELVKNRNLLNERGDLLTLKDLSLMSREQAGNFFTNDYKLIYEYSGFIQPAITLPVSSSPTFFPKPKFTFKSLNQHSEDHPDLLARKIKFKFIRSSTDGVHPSSGSEITSGTNLTIKQTLRNVNLFADMDLPPATDNRKRSPLYIDLTEDEPEAKRPKF